MVWQSFSTLYVREEEFMKKIITSSMILALILTMFPICEVQAASKYTGSYYKTYKVEGRISYPPTYGVTINKVKNNKAKFQVTYLGRNASPLYETNVITAKIKNKTVSFKWKDTWGNSGTGKLRLYNGYVKIKMKQTKTAEWNRSTLDTQGKYIKINKKSNNKKIDSWG